jgi:hypothetical protein
MLWEGIDSWAMPSQADLTPGMKIYSSKANNERMNSWIENFTLSCEEGPSDYRTKFRGKEAPSEMIADCTLVTAGIGNVIGEMGDLDQALSTPDKTPRLKDMWKLHQNFKFHFSVFELQIAKLCRWCVHSRIVTLLPLLGVMQYIPPYRL